MTEEELRSLYYCLHDEEGALLSRIRDVKAELETLEGMADLLDTRIEQVLADLRNKED